MSTTNRASNTNEHQKSLARGATKIPAGLWRRLTNRSPLETASRGAYLAHEQYRERMLGIDTRGFIDWSELSSNPNCVDYDPIGYRTLDRALSYVAVRPGEDVFLDYGCGKGRPILTAAMRPFRRVIGVEMSADLCRAAIANVRKAKRALRCRDIRIHHADAASFVIPDDVTVVFLFNPFRGELLDTTVHRIRSSLQRRPRRLTVVYVLPVTSTDIFAKCDWLERQTDRFSEGLRLRVYTTV